MTGIERLVDIVNDGPYSGGMIHISVQKLREICEQIEREVGVETVKREAMEALAFVEEHGGLDEVKERLMPDGMEWPKYTDGSLVEIGDEVVGPDYGERFRVDTVTFHVNGFTLREKSGVSHWYESDDRFERPAPKVLDADGVEIEVGDDLYSVEGMLKFHVSAIDKKSGRIATEAMFALDKWEDPKMYTRRAPVLAADGKPLREGETVWNVDGTGPYEVSSIDGNLVKMDSGACINRCNLTHERPESWERLDDDATMPAATYCERVGIEVEEGHSFVEPMARDLVRRCKAFAERGQR